MTSGYHGTTRLLRSAEGGPGGLITALRQCVVHNMFLGILVGLISTAAYADQFAFTFARTLPAPATSVSALGFGDDGFLWVLSQDTHFVYKLDPSDGAVLDSFFTSPPIIVDVDVDDGVLYGGGEPEIFRFSTASGESLPRLVGPVVGGSRGLTFIGDDLYVSGVLEGGTGVRLARVDRNTGQLLGSSAPPDLVYSKGIGAIGPYVGYLINLGANVLRIADPITGQWIEDHELFGGGGPSFLCLDTSGSELFVSHRDRQEIKVWSRGSALSFEYADTSGGSGAAGISLALDAERQPHIAYAETGLPGYPLKYARRDGSGWTIERVSTVLAYLPKASLAVELSGVPHICSCDGTRQLVYVKRTGGNWTREVIFSTGADRFLWPIHSIAVATDGYPRVAWTDSPVDFDPHSILYYYRRSSTGWTRETVDERAPSTDVGFGCSLGLNSSDAPYISYGTEDRLLVCARKEGGAWVKETVLSPIDLAATSLAMDASGNPHIACIDSARSNLVYARRISGSWIMDTAYGGPLVGGHLSLSLNPRSDPQIAFVHAQEGLKYASRSNSEWCVEGVESGGWFNSLKVDATGRVHVAYGNVLGVRYAVSGIPVHVSEWPEHTAETPLLDASERDPYSLQILPNPIRSEGGLFRFLVPTGDVLVEVALFDASGRRILTFPPGRWFPGPHALRWDGRDGVGRDVSSGTYFIRYQGADRHGQRRLILIR